MVMIEEGKKASSYETVVMEGRFVATEVRVEDKRQHLAISKAQ